MEITVPDPSHREERPKLFSDVPGCCFFFVCLGTGRVLLEGGRVVSEGWTILVSSVFIFAFG